MQPKKNLTQAQRVMLDKLYTKQFQLKRVEIQNQRDAELSKLRTEAGKQFTKLPEIAKAQALAKKFNEAMKHINFTKLSDKGASFQTREAQLDVTAYTRSRYGYDSRNELPIFTAFEEETKAILVKVDQAENEMRLRIAGSEVTYAEIEAEINAILKGVTL